MSVTSLHLFSGAKTSRFAMLRTFGLLRFSMRRLPDGVLFAKAMGCGKGVAFSLLPDRERYAVMLECARADDEARFIAQPHFQALHNAVHTHRRIELAAYRKHGSWDNLNPFLLQRDSNEKGRVAVLTRASIALHRIPAFIRQSRSTTEALNKASGLEFSLGMGEYPLTHQATFSIWESDAAMTAYAYKDARHIAAIKEKKVKCIFKEEMFVRFRVISDALIE